MKQKNACTNTLGSIGYITVASISDFHSLTHLCKGQSCCLLWKLLLLLASVLELLCGGGRRRNGLCKVTFILSVTSFLSLMSHFFSFFIPSECGIALQTALNSVVHITVPWSLICSVLILLSSAKLWLLVATGSLRRINDLLIPTVLMDANRHRQNVSVFHPFHTSLPNVLGCEMKSAHLALTSSTAAELEKTLSRGTCPS